MSGGELVFRDLGGWISGPCLDEGQMLQAAFPDWRIRRVEPGRGLTAHGPDGERLWAETPAALELKLRAAAARRDS